MEAHRHGGTKAGGARGAKGEGTAKTADGGRRPEIGIRESGTGFRDFRLVARGSPLVDPWLAARGSLLVARGLRDSGAGNPPKRVPLSSFKMGTSWRSLFFFGSSKWRSSVRRDSAAPLLAARMHTPQRMHSGVAFQSNRWQLPVLDSVRPVALLVDVSLRSSGDDHATLFCHF